MQEPKAVLGRWVFCFPLMLDSCCPYISISRGRGSPPRVTSARWKTNTASTSAISDTLTLRQGVLIQNQSSEFFYVISIQCGQSNMQAIRWNRVDLWDNVFLGSSSKTWIAKHPSNQADNVKPPKKIQVLFLNVVFVFPKWLIRGQAKNDDIQWPSTHWLQLAVF